VAGAKTQIDKALTNELQLACGWEKPPKRERVFMKESKIAARNVVENGHRFDFQLSDGTLLHKSEWNGEVYTVGHGANERTYRPIYAEVENENGGYDIVDFE
jgi:hypothetical protein